MPLIMPYCVFHGSVRFQYTVISATHYVGNDNNLTHFLGVYVEPEAQTNSYFG